MALFKDYFKGRTARLTIGNRYGMNKDCRISGGNKNPQI